MAKTLENGGGHGDEKCIQFHQLEFLRKFLATNYQAAIADSYLRKRWVTYDIDDSRER